MSTGFFYTEAPLQTMGKRQKLRQKNKGNKSPGERKGRDFFLSLNFFFFFGKLYHTDFSLPQKWNKGKEQKVESISSACL